MRPLWRRLRSALIVVALTSFSGGVGLHTYYGTTRPASPEAEHGRVHALNHHGTYVYLTRTEQLSMLGAFTAFVLAALGALIVHAVNDRERRPR